MTSQRILKSEILFGWVLDGCTTSIAAYSVEKSYPTTIDISHIPFPLSLQKLATSLPRSWSRKERRNFGRWRKRLLSNDRRKIRKKDGRETRNLKARHDSENLEKIRTAHPELVADIESFQTMYATHAIATGANGSPEYHTNSIGRWNTTGDIDICRRGLSAFRNARDWARKQRKTLFLMQTARQDLWIWARRKRRRKLERVSPLPAD